MLVPAVDDQPNNDLARLKLRLLTRAIDVATALTSSALTQHRTGDGKNAARLSEEAIAAYEDALLGFRLAEADGWPVAILRERLRDLKERLEELETPDGDLK